MFVFLIEIFCQIDDFCNNFDSNFQHFFLSGPAKKRRKPCAISLSEIMTIVMWQQFAGQLFKRLFVVIQAIHIRQVINNHSPNVF
jgi:hypothetical protein